MTDRLISCRGALSDPTWLGNMLRGDSFAAMRTLLIASQGEQLTADELALYTQLTGRLESPTEAVEEAWIIAGRP